MFSLFFPSFFSYEVVNIMYFLLRKDSKMVVILVFRLIW